MTHEELNTSLYEKCFAAQEHYREWLLSLPPEEILNHTYEYTIREDILLALETNDLSDEQATALLSSPAPLDDVFHDFEQIEGDHMDLIRGCIETRADDILKDQREAALKQPVYKFPASYAKEHGETAEYITEKRRKEIVREVANEAIEELNMPRSHVLLGASMCSLPKMNNRDSIFDIWIPEPYKSIGQCCLAVAQFRLNICCSKASTVPWLHKPFQEAFPM